MLIIYLMLTGTLITSYIIVKTETVTCITQNTNTGAVVVVIVW